MCLIGCHSSQEIFIMMPGEAGVARLVEATGAPPVVVGNIYNDVRWSWSSKAG